jgi:hypothetical protein
LRYDEIYHEISAVGAIAATAIAFRWCLQKPPKENAGGIPAVDLDFADELREWLLQRYLCGVDGARYPAVLTPIYLQGNCVNVRKRC